MKIASAAQGLGAVKRLPREMVKALVDKRQKAGLSAPEESQPGPDVATQVMNKVLKSVGHADAALTRSLVEEIAQAVRADAP